MYHTLFHAITNLGDSSLLLPASAALFGYLLFRGERRLARAWAIALVAGLGTTVALKLTFHTCNVASGAMLIRSPSGHASFATMFYVMAALIAAQGRSAFWKVALPAAGVVLAVLVGLTRTKWAHTPAEVVFGWAIGAAAVWLFVRLRAGEDHFVRLRPLAVPLVLAGLLLQGQHLGAEPLIKEAAQRISSSLDVCW